MDRYLGSVGDLIPAICRRRNCGWIVMVYYDGQLASQFDEYYKE